MREVIRSNEVEIKVHPYQQIIIRGKVTQNLIIL